ncbi:hypothetical protein B0H10DRAFT_2004715, partial [Mycena sp. CBHHK59/15]
MSLQVNLSNRDINDAYLNVLNARGIDWAVFTYEGGTNDLKVQSTGDGGLEELEEEFSDGRMQYAFARVLDPNSNLPKFVQINWCGDGVPEQKKGLFHTHANAVASYLRGTHVVLNARNETDVTPALIMSRVEAASGAKYSAHKEQARKFEPIAPVGTNYTPIGKPDISTLRKGPTPATTSAPPAPRPGFGAPKPAASAASLYGRTVDKRTAPEEAWLEDPPPVAAVAPPPPPAASRPPVLPTVSRPSFAASAPIRSPVTASAVPTKPADDDRIAPVGTAYTPVTLAAPKKLKNPFAAFEQQAQAAPPAPVPSAGKKLTWSERQAQAKKLAEQEEAQSRGAAFQAPAAPVFKSSAPAFGRPAAQAQSTPRNFGSAVSVAPTPPHAPPPPPVAVAAPEP